MKQLKHFGIRIDRHSRSKKQKCPYCQGSGSNESDDACAYCSGEGYTFFDTASDY